MAKEYKQILVTVAPRRSVFLPDPIGIDGKPKGPGKFYGPGSEILVDEYDVERLYKTGFIVDPNARLLTPAEIAAADLSAYVPSGNQGEGAVSVVEKTTQGIKEGRG